MNDTQMGTKAHKIKIIVDIRVTADPPGHLARAYGYNSEAYAKVLEKWANEFNDFIRDHRSQDPVILSVERVMGEVCSKCKCDYDLNVLEEDGRLFCASCGSEFEGTNP